MRIFEALFPKTVTFPIVIPLLYKKYEIINAKEEEIPTSIYFLISISVSTLNLNVEFEVKIVNNITIIEILVKKLND